ncbi:MAG: STAS domain-containing protein [Planctomycetota bacterium]|jgi:anti-anti-sigma factor
MKLSYEDHGAITVLKLKGELVTDHTDLFRRSCHERFESGSRNVVLDLEELKYVDSAGLESLLWLQEETAGLNGQLRLVGLDPTIAKILEITRLDRRFSVHASIESAAKELRKRT